MSNDLHPLSGPVDASGEPEQGAAMRVKDAALQDIMALVVPAISDAAIVGASYGPADVVRVVEIAVRELTSLRAAAVPSSPDEPICGAGVNHMGKLRNRCGGTGQPSITGPNGIGRQCPACGMLTVPYPNGTVRKHGVLANSVGGGVPRLFANFCQDEHEPINHNDSEHERCPLCRANDEIAVLRARLAALPPSSPVADSPNNDYQAACEVLPDSLGRPLAARIQLVLDNLRRESHIGCELRRELDGGIERDAKAVEERWPEAAAYLRSHTHIEDGV